MKISYLYEEQISKILNFNDENGKYEKKVGNYKIELNSWNNKLFVEKENEGNTEIISIPTEIIKSIININTITPIQFEEENNE